MSFIKIAKESAFANKMVAIDQAKQYIHYIATRNDGTRNEDQQPDLTLLFKAVDTLIRHDEGLIKYKPAFDDKGYLFVKDFNKKYTCMKVKLGKNKRSIKVKCIKPNNPEMTDMPDCFEWKSTDIPITWFNKRAVEAVNNQFILSEDMAYFYKMFGICADSTLRNLMSKFIESITKCCYINLGANGFELAPLSLDQLNGFIRAEESTAGIRGRKFPSNDKANNIWRAPVAWEIKDGVLEYAGKKIDLPEEANTVEAIEASGGAGLEIVWDVIHERGMNLMRLPNKTNDQYTKIFGNEDGVKVGKRTFRVMLGAPVIGKFNKKNNRAVQNWYRQTFRTFLAQGVKGKDVQAAIIKLVQESVENALCTGAVYCDDLLTHIGVARFVCKVLGIKATIGSKSPFKGVKDDVVLCNTSSVKGALNMILNVLGVMSREEQVEISVANAYEEAKLTEIALKRLYDAGVVKSSTCIFMGHACSFYYVDVEEDVYVTNFYSLYGYRYTEEVVAGADDKEDWSEDDERSSSYYLDAQIDVDQLYSLPEKIMQDEADGIIVKSGAYTSFSIREFSNFYFSYVLDQDQDGNYFAHMDKMRVLIDELKEEHKKRSSKAHRKMQEMIVNGTANMETVDESVIVKLIDLLFRKPAESPIVIGGKTITGQEEFIPVNPNGWRLDMYGDNVELLTKNWKILIHGHKFEDGSYWPGLDNEDGLIVRVGGYPFIIPSSIFLKRGIFPVDKETVDTVPEYYFSGGMQALFKLFEALRVHTRQMAESNKSIVDWAVNAAQHMTNMNAAIFEDELNRLNVKGSYLTMQPRFWGLEHDDYACRVTTLGANLGKDANGKRNNVKRMSYSKDPVIFDKALAGVMVDNHYPEYVFGKLNQIERFALRSVAHVNNVLMMSQENDTDGDLCCLRWNIGQSIPLYTGQWEVLAKRVSSYVNGEKDLAMTMKAWKWYTLHEIQLGIEHNMVAKNNISLMTSNYFRAGVLLNATLVSGHTTAKWAKLLWSFYGYIVQDEAMKQVKNEMGGTTSNFYAALRASKMASTMYDPMVGEHVPAGEVMTYGLGALGDGLLSRFSQYTDINGVEIEDRILKTAQAYADGSELFNYYHYEKSDKRDKKFPVSGMDSGTVRQMTELGMLHLLGANKLHSHDDWLAYNFLSRGYYNTACEQCPTVGGAESAKLTLKVAGYEPNGVFEIIKMSNAVNKAAGHKAIGVHEAFSLAYINDKDVMKGWRKQHQIVEIECLPEYDENSTYVVNWFAMIAEIVTEGYNDPSDDVVDATQDDMDVLASAVASFIEDNENLVYPSFTIAEPANTEVVIEEVKDVVKEVVNAPEELEEPTLVVFKLKKDQWAIVEHDVERKKIVVKSATFKRLKDAKEAYVNGGWQAIQFDMEFDLDDRDMVIYKSCSSNGKKI